MRDVFYLAWRYLAFHRLKSSILVLSITLIIFLPVGLKLLVNESVESLTSRAADTPLIVGAKGSPLELVLNALYFETDTPESISFAESQRVQDSGYAMAIPLYTRFKARHFPIVGTTLDYFDFRQLDVAAGRQMTVLGECVIGAAVSEKLGLGVGDSLISSPESVFDLAGVYPLKMHISGVLSPSGTADDRAVFVDLKTAWIIEGLAHGHQDLAKPDAAGQVLKREKDLVIGNASVMNYSEITSENMGSFHFHGDPAGFPITSVIAVPHDEKAGTLLQGEYLSQDERMQIFDPTSVMNELLGTIITVQDYIIAALVIVGSSTLMTAILVFMLSFRLRKREVETMHMIGGSRSRVLAILSAEVAVVISLAAVLAAVLLFAFIQFEDFLIRLYLL